MPDIFTNFVVLPCSISSYGCMAWWGFHRRHRDLHGPYAPDHTAGDHPAAKDSQKMSALQPQIKEIQDKYKSDPQKMQEEMSRIGWSPACSWAAASVWSCNLSSCGACGRRSRACSPLRRSTC